MELISYRCAACRMLWTEEEHDDLHFSGACPRCGTGGIPRVRTSEVQDIGPGDADGELELDDDGGADDELFMTELREVERKLATAWWTIHQMRQGLR